jgi:rare lipoprotein A
MERYYPSGLTVVAGTGWRSSRLISLQIRRQTAALATLLAATAWVSAACSGNHRPASPATPGNAITRGTASWYGPKFNGHRTASGERYDMRQLTAAHPTLPFGTLLEVTNLDNGRQVVVRVNDRGPFGRRRVIDLSYAAARELGMVGPGTAEVELAVVNRSEPPASAPAMVLAAAAPAPGGFATARWDTTATASTATIGAAAPAIAAASVTSTMLPSASGSAPPAAAEPAGDTGGRAEIESGRPGVRGATGARLNYTVQVGAFGEPERAEELQRDLSRLYPEAAVHSDGTWCRVQIGLFGDREQAERMRLELVAAGISAIVVTAH